MVQFTMYGSSAVLRSWPSCYRCGGALAISAGRSERAAARMGNTICGEVQFTLIDCKGHNSCRRGISTTMKVLLFGDIGLSASRIIAGINNHSYRREDTREDQPWGSAGRSVTIPAESAGCAPRLAVSDL